MAPTFRERYCLIHKIDPADFEEHVLPRTLYFHARPVRKMLGALADYFAADREFLRSVGDLRSRRFFHAEAGEFHAHPANRNLLRRLFRLRVSAERVRLLMEESWGGLDSNPPVGAANVNAR